MSLMLKNNTGGTSKIGYVVIVDPNNSQAFVYAPSGSSNILGVVAQSVPRYAMCEIATSGKAGVYVSESVVRGAQIRAQGSTCKQVRNTDTEYFRIGTTLESGKGLISCVLNLFYNRSLGAGLTIDDVKADSTIASVITNSHASGSDNQDLSSYATINFAIAVAVAL